MEFDRIPEEMLDKVSGGLTEERKQELDTYIRNCKMINSSLQTTLQVMTKNGAPLEEIIYVRENW